MRHALTTCLLLATSAPLFAQTAPTSATGTLVELAAEASRPTANDLFHATVFAEASNANSAALARQVNQQIAAALAVAKDYPSVKVRTGSTYTNPVYGKNERSIESWRMRSEIQLDSRDAPALAELLGKLQSSLGVSQINATPAPETAQKAEADATIGAIQAFRERAGLIAGALGKKYKIRELNVGSSNRGPVYPMFRGKALMAAEAAPMPVEGGESQVQVNINGKIELTD
ncbi:MAG TPA: SIMPL domain-containing protein [Rhodocyclaceae bacterium]|nr:SIMPL domain-containing protein [Rhodocyclaceae bacterium]